MPTHPPAGDPFRELLKVVAAKLEQAAYHVNRLELDIVDARNELDDLAAVLRRLLQNPCELEAIRGDLLRVLKEESSAGNGTDRGWRSRVLLVDALEERARWGADKVGLHFRADGTCEAAIDGQSLDLPPKLAALLEALAADEGESKDGLVAWKLGEDIRVALGTKFGGKVLTRAALSNLVLRLRNRLREGGLHGNFVQRKPAHDLLRFAVKRRPPCDPEPGESGKNRGGENPGV